MGSTCGACQKEGQHPSIPSRLQVAEQCFSHKDSYPLLRNEESLASLRKSRVFSRMLDLANGYWQNGGAPS